MAGADLYTALNEALFYLGVGTLLLLIIGGAIALAITLTRDYRDDNQKEQK